MSFQEDEELRRKLYEVQANRVATIRLFNDYSFRLKQDRIESAYNERTKMLDESEQRLDAIGDAIVKHLGEGGPLYGEYRLIEMDFRIKKAATKKWYEDQMAQAAELRSMLKEKKRKNVDEEERVWFRVMDDLQDLQEEANALSVPSKSIETVQDTKKFAKTLENNIAEFEVQLDEEKNKIAEFYEKWGSGEQVLMNQARDAAEATIKSKKILVQEYRAEIIPLVQNAQLSRSASAAPSVGDAPMRSNKGSPRGSPKGSERGRSRPGTASQVPGPSTAPSVGDTPSRRASPRPTILPREKGKRAPSRMSTGSSARSSLREESDD